ncbi:MULTISPECIES: WG repeat-containing protein [unclassified Paenibacillus]|uniref:WG repeat-containing protein n=1 Tax=unclassified Paenibacillus TaxID=185978 RepID=UPI0036384032
MKKLKLIFVALGIILINFMHSTLAQAAEIEIVVPQYDSISIYSNDYMVVKKEGKWGLIDKTGQIVVSPKYTYMGNLSEGLALINQDNRYGFLDINGKVAIEPTFESAKDFKEGFAGVTVRGKMGFIDKTGSIVIEPKYLNVDNFSEGLAHVNKDYKHGYIDTSGKMVIQPIYDYATDFTNGLAFVAEGGQGFMIDHTGAVIREASYNKIEKFSDNVIEVYSNEASSYYKLGLIDNNGNTIAEPVYEKIGKLNEGLARIKKDGKWGFINETGQIVIDPVFDGVFEFSDGLAQAELHGKYGFIDKKGQFVIDPRYDFQNNFKDGFALVNIGWKFGIGGGKYGFIDKTGKAVITASYDKAQDFQEGIAIVNKNNKYQLISNIGKLLYEFKNAYDEIYPLSSKLMKVGIGKKYGLIANPIHPSVYSTDSKLRVNGKVITLEAYNINGNNYFKLRDIATAVNSTEKNFNVNYDADKGSINITLNQPYSKVGGELTVSTVTEMKEATMTTSGLFVNDKEIDLTAYNINGNNYFKLRDIAQISNFSVSWDANTNSIDISTHSEYIIERQDELVHKEPSSIERIKQLFVDKGFDVLEREYKVSPNEHIYYIVYDKGEEVLELSDYQKLNSSSSSRILPKSVKLDFILGKNELEVVSLITEIIEKDKGVPLPHFTEILLQNIRGVDLKAFKNTGTKNLTIDGTNISFYVSRESQENNYRIEVSF